MSEQVQDGLGEALPPQPNGELIHWMDKKPLSVGPKGLSATAGAAFSLGVIATVAVLALVHWLGPRRVVVVRARRGG
jgi:hypothetical protein